MTVRLPLVQNGGQVEQLQAGDTLGGVSSGASTPTTAQTTLSVPAHTQMLFRQSIVLGSNSIVLGTDASLIGV